MINLNNYKTLNSYSILLKFLNLIDQEIPMKCNLKTFLACIQLLKYLSYSFPHFLICYNYKTYDSFV